MARIKYYNPTTQQWEYADRNPLPTGTADGDILAWDETAGAYLPKQITEIIPNGDEVSY